MWSSFIAFVNAKYAILMPALIGGLVDYLNQIQNGKRTWNLIDLSIHLLSALFFGWAAGVLAAEMQYSKDMISAAGGAGGFLGVRLADMFIYKMFGDRRHK